MLRPTVRRPTPEPFKSIARPVGCSPTHIEPPVAATRPQQSSRRAPVCGARYRRLPGAQCGAFLPTVRRDAHANADGGPRTAHCALQLTRRRKREPPAEWRTRAEHECAIFQSISRSLLATYSGGALWRPAAKGWPREATAGSRRGANFYVTATCCWCGAGRLRKHQIGTSPAIVVCRHCWARIWLAAPEQRSHSRGGRGHSVAQLVRPLRHRRADSRRPHRPPIAHLHNSLALAHIVARRPIGSPLVHADAHTHTPPTTISDLMTSAQWNARASISGASASRPSAQVAGRCELSSQSAPANEQLVPAGHRLGRRCAPNALLRSYGT